MSRTKSSLTLLLFIILFCISCQGSAQSKILQKSSKIEITPSTPNTKRILGMDILNTTPASSFENNMTTAKSIGATGMILGLGWNQIEKVTPNDCLAPGQYTDPGNALAIFNQILPLHETKLSLSISPISTSINLLPENLKDKGLNNPLVVCRFNKMLEFVFSKIPNIDLISIQFGNEIDGFSSADKDLSFWSEYWGFFSQVSQTAKKLRPNLKVSITGTLYGTIGESSNVLAKGGLEQLYKISDIVSVTYYPLNSNFSVKDPAVIDREITKLINLYPNKLIYFNEVGYPSGSRKYTKLNDDQEQFVEEIFKSWDKHINHIPFISFLRLNDLSREDAEFVARSYGLETHQAFISFLEKLGFKHFDGTHKDSFNKLRQEGSKRFNKKAD